VTIATVPFYWVRELVEIVNWSTARGLLEQGPQGDILKYHNAEVWVNPYTSKTLLTRREKVVVPPVDELADASSSIFAMFVKDLPALQTVVDHIFHDDIADDIAKLLGTILALLLRLCPLLLPSVSGTTWNVLLICITGGNFLLLGHRFGFANEISFETQSRKIL
jgi:hypothetical protein